MKNYNTEIREIIHRQQELESLKTGGHTINHPYSIYAQKILSKCSHSSRRIKQIETALAYSFIAFMLLLTLTNILFKLLAEKQTNIYKIVDRSQYPSGIATIAIENGDYDTARTILLEQMEKHPYGPASFLTYAELCLLEGDQDQAATTLINFLNEVYGIQNINDNNLLYKKLKELTGPFSPDVEKAYQECMSACAKSAENFAILDALMESEKYQLALHFCDSIKQQNVTDYYLDTYYFKCYMQLEQYEVCADYFLSLADEWKSEDAPINFRLPFKSSIRNCLNQLKPLVSEATQKKIDDACLLINDGF